MYLPVLLTATAKQVLVLGCISSLLLLEQHTALCALKILLNFAPASVLPKLSSPSQSGYDTLLEVQTIKDNGQGSCKGKDLFCRRPLSVQSHRPLGPTGDEEEFHAGKSRL